MKLELVVTNQYYDLIASGEKKEEYRAYNLYWKRRLLQCCDIVECASSDCKECGLSYRPFDTVVFYRGSTSTFIEVECKGIRLGYGKIEWGAPVEICFRISLGRILHSVNTSHQ